MSFLTRKYPFKQSKNWLKDGIVYGVAIWAILYFLQPFGFSMYQGNKFLVAAIFGLVTTCCYALYGWAILKPLALRIQPWRIWHDGCTVLGLIFFIAICNFLLFSFLFHSPINVGGFLLFLYWTLIIGVIITVMSIGIEYNRSLRERMEAMLSNTTEEQKDVKMVTAIENERLNYDNMGANRRLIVGCSNFNGLKCFDGQCPNCLLNGTLSNYPLSWTDRGQMLVCQKCSRKYNPNAEGIPTNGGEDDRRLIEYRIEFNGDRLYCHN